jgi:hypothetical protein
MVFADEGFILGNFFLLDSVSAPLGPVDGPPGGMKLGGADSPFPVWFVGLLGTGSVLSVWFMESFLSTMVGLLGAGSVLLARFVESWSSAVGLLGVIDGVVTCPKTTGMGPGISTLREFL